jgi:hypothetical protein
MRWTTRFITEQAAYLRAIALCGLILCLLLTNDQVDSLFSRQAPGAGSRSARSSYYLIHCANGDGSVMHPVTPLPESRYIYNDQYGWFDKTHVGTGNPSEVISGVKTAVAADGGIISISQPIRDGITGYTGNYLVSGDIAPGEVLGVALGIYMDWSIRFEAWQGTLPRSLVGPLTPFAIEDLPTQYLGFYESATNMELAAIFACYLGQTEATEAPPHIWISNKSSGHPNEQNQLHIERLTNRTFSPLVLTKEGWQHVDWPEPLRLYPVPSSNSTWIFDSDQTWYLNQTIP